MIEFLKKYKTQIFNFITIFLIVTFVIYPGLTVANTFLNILAGIGFLLLILWGGVVLYDYVRSSDESVDEVKPIEPTNVKPKRKPKTK
jgi:hypothetical protein